MPIKTIEPIVIPSSDWGFGSFFRDLCPPSFGDIFRSLGSFWEIFKGKEPIGPVKPIRWSLLTSTDEQRLIKQTLEWTSLAVEEQQFKDREATLLLILQNTEQFLAKFGTHFDDLRLGRDIGEMAQDLKISTPEARSRLINQAVQLRQETAQQLQSLRTEYEKNGSVRRDRLEKGNYLLTQLGEISFLKGERRDTSSIVSTLLREAPGKDLGTLQRAAKKATDIARSTFMPDLQQSASLTDFDAVLTFHEGNLFADQDKGSFLFVELPSDFPEKERQQITAESVRSLVSGSTAVRKKVGPKGKIENHPNGDLYLPIVRATLRNGKLVADKKGSILLYAEPVEQAIKDTFRMDFGTRPRLEKSADGRYMVRIFKEYKGRADHHRLNDVRVRTASADRGRALVVMQKLLEVMLLKQSSQLSGNTLVNLSSLIELFEASDLSHLRGNPMRDPTYSAQRTLFDLYRKHIQVGAFDHTSSRSTQEILSERGGSYSWGKDKDRIKVLRETQSLLAAFIRQVDGATEEIRKVPFAATELSWFRNELNRLKDLALSISETLNARLGAGANLETLDQTIAQMLPEFVQEMAQFNKEATVLAGTVNSKRLQGKMEKYLTRTTVFRRIFLFLFGWLLGYPKDPQVLRNIHAMVQSAIIQPSAQIATRTVLLVKELSSRAPFSPSLLSTVEALWEQQRNVLFQMAAAASVGYKLRGDLGGSRSKNFFFPDHGKTKLFLRK